MDSIKFNRKNDIKIKQKRKR